jgi:isoquinoline 1-oxidoreductase beta subunit
LIQQLSAYLKIKPENVKVNVPFMGGAFGRKAYFDYVMEAAHISKQLNAPIKVIWTREDDMTQGLSVRVCLTDWKVPLMRKVL